MDRIKWFEVDWSSSYDNVSKNIIIHKFTEDSRYGFKVHKRRDDYVSASYVELKEIEEEIENPITNELIVYKRVLFDRNDFVIENNKFGIELINPPRTYRSLINIIASFSDFNISIKQFNYNLSKLIPILRYKFEKLKINQIECSEVKINSHTIGKLIAKNNQDNLFVDIEKFLGDKEYVISKIKCSLYYDNKFVDFELTNNGTLKAKKNIINYISPIVKESILTIKKQ